MRVVEVLLLFVHKINGWNVELADRHTPILACSRPFFLARRLDYMLREGVAV